jgi:2-polyprenyl-3-methyl-5-hydroxy-6-metoxy-1,4-benzoquinol methylase
LLVLITDYDRAQNRALHEQDDSFGRSGYKLAPVIKELAKDYPIKTILDYGCGKQTLRDALPEFKVYGYDPAIPGLEQARKADLVVCSDVLEHISAQSIQEVLADMAKYGSLFLILISLVEGTRRMPDGSLAHKTVMTEEWWLKAVKKLGKVTALPKTAPTRQEVLWLVSR